MKKNIISYMKRLLLCSAGVALTYLAASIFYLIKLGSDPFQVFVIAVHKNLNITYGQASILLNGLIVMFFIIFKRKYIGFAMFLSVFLSGLCIDGFNLLSNFITSDLPVFIRYLLGLAGCISLALGCSLYLHSNMGASPPDGVGLFISEKTNIPYKNIRIGTDITYTAAGAVLGGVVGAVTVMAVVLTGPLIGIFQKFLFTSSGRVVIE